MPNPGTALVHAAFGGGLDQRTDSRHSDPGHLLTATNVRFDRNGQLRKRAGSTLLASSMGGVSLIPGHGRVFGDSQEVVVTDGRSVGSYSPAEATLVPKGPISEAVLRSRPGPTDSSGTSNADVAIGNGVILTAYITGSASISVSVRDLITDVELRSLHIAASGHNPRVAFVGSVGVIAWCTGNDIKCIRLLADLSLSGATFLATFNRNDGPFDLCALSDRFAIAYGDGSGSHFLTIKTFDSSAVAIASTTTAETVGATFGSVGLRGTTGETLWTIYVTSAANVARVIGLNTASLAITTAAFTVWNGVTFAKVGIERMSPTTACCLLETDTALTAGHMVRCPVVDTSGAILASALNRGTNWAYALSKPFQHGVKTYAVLGIGNANTSATIHSDVVSTVICDLGSDDLTSINLQVRPVAQSSMRTTLGSSTTKLLCSMPTAGDDSYSFSVAVERNNAGLSGLQSITADFSYEQNYQSGTLGSLTYLSAGSPCYYDGSQCAESGFVYDPLYLKATTAGGGSMALGTYGYMLIYEWIDWRGNVHRSAPSIQLSVTLAGADSSATIVCPMLTVTSRMDSFSALNVKSQAQLVLYRTTVNSVSPFYRAASVLDITNNESVSILDTLSDASIVTNPTIYTSGGALDKVAPPSMVALVSHQGRLWGIADDRRTVWYTDEFVEGEAASFHDEFTLPFDGSDDLVGLASLDEKLVIFGRRKIYWLAGVGPNEKGTEGDFGQPQRVASDVGCVDARSIVVTQQGVLFQSPVDLYLLDRSLQVVNIGQPISDALEANSTITSAAIHPSGGRAILTANGPSTTGVRLVYDYRVNQWTTDDVRGNSASTQVISAATVGSAYYWLDREGRLFKEDPLTYLDNSTFSPSSVETTWMKPAGLQGYARIYRITVLLERYTPADLTLSIAKDYESTYFYAQTWSANTIEGFATLPMVQLSVSVSIPKCEALKFKIVDSTPTLGPAVGTGRGYAMIGVSYEAEALTETFRLPAYQKG